ncbi:MAG: trypsin-like serine protease [Myxococcota bacterium]
MSWNVNVTVALCIALLGAAACVGEEGTRSSTQPPSSIEARKLPIIGGSNESGYPGVGALTFRFPGFGYQGSFCTGTLIDPQWVLTAAHCMTEHEGFELTPDIVLFYVGTDARPTRTGEFPAGSFYQADRFIIHPQYNDRDLANDIGLVHLAEPVTGVQAFPYNTLNLNSFLGDDVLYVGYGVTDGANRTGGGVKRSTSVPLGQLDLDESRYYSQYEGSGTCFGDSGGPGLLNINGQLSIVGVNSAVSGSGRDPCRGIYITTLVNAYATWIADQIGAPPPDCTRQADVCSCQEACQPNGSCDNTACQVLSCEEIYGCFVDCGQDAACGNDCYFRGTDTARSELDTMLGCFSANCANITNDAQYQTCVQNNCSRELDGCFPRQTGNLNCEDMYSCLLDCGNDEGCQTDCFNQGTSLAQDQLIAMNGCFDAQCGNIADEDAFLECATSRCANEIDGCFPADNCAITGGDCGAGQACYPTSTGSTNCVQSDGIALDQPCDPNLTDRLACADGLVCLDSSDGGGLCSAFCTRDADCPAPLSCLAPVFTGIDNIGVCAEPGDPGECVDADNDGSCVEDDCDDTNAARTPGAAEACGDGVDNNCDGTIDEGCDNCVDGDGDGFCAGTTDCDDTSADVSPSADEICGDTLDNDCNGLVDDGCGGLVDGGGEDGGSEDGENGEDGDQMGGLVGEDDDTPGLISGSGGTASSGTCAVAQGHQPASGAGAWWALVVGLIGAMAIRRR